MITLDKRPRDDGRQDKPRPERPRTTPRAPTLDIPAGAGKEVFRVEVGHANGVQPGNLVGAIANEAGVTSANIGRIEIFDEYSTIELPAGMPKEIFRLLKKVWVSGRQLDISRIGAAPAASKPFKKRSAAPKKSNAAHKAAKPAKVRD